MKKRSAFSLMELSIVVLIIGILIAGVTQSTKLVNKARLRTARSLTASAPVLSIEDLALWYETSSDDSFASTVKDDGDEVLVWYDINKQAPSSQRLNATASTGTAPYFYENIFNGGIPAVRFDGTDNVMAINTDLEDLLISSDFTFFVVEQKRASSASDAYWIGQDSSACSATANPCFGYNSDTVVDISTLSTTVSAAAYSTPTARIHTGMLDTTSTSELDAGRRYWYNGGAAAGDGSDTTTTQLTSFTTPQLGETGASASEVYYNGDLAEIIIYRRALTTNEREEVEAYLAKKYNVTVETS